MAEIVIDPEFANLCRPLTAEEKAQLEANLQADGCLDPLRLWGDILLDGHNRYEICARLGLSFNTEHVEIADRADAVKWVVTNQLGRRNLSSEEISYLRGKRYEMEKIDPEEHLRRRVDAAIPAVLRYHGKIEEAEIFEKNQEIKRGTENRRDVGKTAQRLSQEFGAAVSTIWEDAAFALAVDKIQERLGNDAAALIRTGKSGMTKKAVREFAKDDGMTIDKFNDARIESQSKKNLRKKHKRTAPKAPPLTQLRRSRNSVDIVSIERMRQFLNALEQLATTPLKAKTLALERAWPDNFRQRVHAALPLAVAYLNEFSSNFPHNKEPF